MKLIRYIIILYLIIQMSTITVISNDTLSEKLSSSENYIFVTKWGSKGRDEGQFGHPTPNSAYWYKITDQIIERLKDKLDKNKLAILESVKDKDLTDDEFRLILRNMHRSKLSEDAEESWLLFDYCASDKLSDLEEYKNGPCHIAVDTSGNVYVADLYNKRIQKFDSNGNFIITWGREIGGWIRSLAVDSKDNVYVLDSSEGPTMQKENGDFVSTFSGGTINKFDCNGNLITKWGLCADRLRTLAERLTAGPDDNIYVTDIINHTLQVFNSEGEFIKKELFPENLRLEDIEKSKMPFLPQPSYDNMVIDQENNLFIIYISCSGIEDKFLRKNKLPDNDNNIIKFEPLFIEKDIIGKAVNIALDKTGNIFVVDKGNNCIVKFDNSGNFITKFGSFGSGDGQFNRPEAIAVDSKGNVYVMDTGNYRIQKFAPVYKKGDL